MIRNRIADGQAVGLQHRDNLIRGSPGCKPGGFGGPDDPHHADADGFPVGRALKMVSFFQRMAQSMAEI